MNGGDEVGIVCPGDGPGVVHIGCKWYGRCEPRFCSNDILRCPCWRWCRCRLWDRVRRRQIGAHTYIPRLGIVTPSSTYPVQLRTIQQTISPGHQTQIFPAVQKPPLLQQCPLFGTQPAVPQQSHPLGQRPDRQPVSPGRRHHPVWQQGSCDGQQKHRLSQYPYPAGTLLLSSTGRMTLKRAGSLTSYFSAPRLRDTANS